jgi:hypothetical protein
MAKGKHRAQAERREQQKQEEARLAALSAIDREEELLAIAERDLDEIDTLTERVIELKDQIAVLSVEQEKALRAEIASLLRDITELTFVHDRELRSRNRRSLAYGGGIEYMESMMDEHGEDTQGALLAEGVHKTKRLPLEAVELIQRARRLRRPGTPSRVQSKEHQERLERIASEQEETFATDRTS